MYNLQKIVQLRTLAKVSSSFNKHYSICCCHKRIENVGVNNSIISKARFVSTVEAKTTVKDESLTTRILNKIPFINIQQTKVKVAAYLLYEEIADKINYIDFFEKFDMPDTFYSWFVITELHIWMLAVRSMAEGVNGRHLRNGMVEALWADVAQRVKKLGAGNPALMRDNVAELSEQLQAALIAYDEGLQSDDIVLAGALWRRIFQQRFTEPEHLDHLVNYVRKQITLLDNVASKQLFEDKIVKWEPLPK